MGQFGCTPVAWGLTRSESDLFHEYMSATSDQKLCIRGENCGKGSKSFRHFLEDFPAPHSSDVIHSKSEHSAQYKHIIKSEMV